MLKFNEKEDLDHVFNYSSFNSFSYDVCRICARPRQILDIYGSSWELFFYVWHKAIN